jgi:hypothetical protein
MIRRLPTTIDACVENPKEDYLDFCQTFWVKGSVNFRQKYFIFNLGFIAFLLTSLFVLENLTLLMIYDNSNDDENNNDNHNDSNNDNDNNNNNNDSFYLQSLHLTNLEIYRFRK